MEYKNADNNTVTPGDIEVGTNREGRWEEIGGDRRRWEEGVGE